MLTLLSAIKLVAEIALFALIGQWILGLLTGAKRDLNFVYRLLSILTTPFVRAMRIVAPRQVIDRHLPLALFLVLTMVWLVATATRISVCIERGIHLCRWL